MPASPLAAAGVVRDDLLSMQPAPPSALSHVQHTGLYAWWDLSAALSSHYPAKFPVVDAGRPLYIGIAARQSLGDRGLFMHLKTTRMSTLRRSLAALLKDEIDLVPGVTDKGSGKFTLDPEHEERLTRWMLANLATTWVAHESPHEVEEVIVREVLPPLNDRFAHHGGYFQPMSDLRVELRRASRERCGSDYLSART